MHDDLRRRLTLRDVLIVVAFLALGFGLLRLRITFADVPRFFRSAFTPVPWELPVGVLVLRLSGLVELAIPCFLSWTLGLLILRVALPRPPIRCLFRQPGFVGCVAFLAIAVCSYAATFASLAIRGRLASVTTRELIGFHSTASLLMTQFGGWGMAAAWIILGLSGRWRFEASWIDRFGRAMGVFWLVSALIVTDLMTSIVLNP
jgi:hypothetical protein